MILKSSNWKPSFTRSIKGRSDYNFLNQIFESDVDKLRIEVSIVNGFSQTQILPATLTVIYSENIDDEIFTISVGDKKPLTTLIDNLKPYAFKLLLNNPNKSPLLVLLQQPKIKRINLSQYPQYMPFFPEGTGSPAPADPALLAAVAANAAATAGLVTAINAQPAAIANAVNNDTTKTLPPEQYIIDMVPVLVLIKNNLTRGANISNQGNTKVKLWVSDDPIAPGTGYNSTGYLFHMEGKGSYEIPEPFFKSNVWAVGNVSAGQVSVTRSIDI
jgi:hypothetical protein